MIISVDFWIRTPYFLVYYTLSLVINVLSGMSRCYTQISMQIQETLTLPKRLLTAVHLQFRLPYTFFGKVCAGIPASLTSYPFYGVNVSNLSVTLTSYATSCLQDGQSRTVRLFQFNEWPEQGMPKSGMSFLQFTGQVHKTKEQFGQEGPIAVHCRWALLSWHMTDAVCLLYFS